MDNLKTKSQSEILSLSDKYEAIYKLNKGDMVLLNDGSEMEFKEMKRTKFVASMKGKSYSVPVGMFVKVLCKVKVEVNPNIISVNFPVDILPTQNWYKELKKDDFFYIVRGKHCIAFQFVEILRNKIIGKHLVDGHKVTIDLTFEGGKIK